MENAMKKIDFMGWKNCVELSSGDFRLIVTTDVGPRIIGGFIGKGQNLFYVDKAEAGKSGGDEWKIYGGHRLWHAPEAKPRTYCPDNSKVSVTSSEDGVTFSSGTELTTGISKSFTVKPMGNRRFAVSHKLRNESQWDLQFAVWALTVMAPGGEAVIPLPQGDRSDLLPNRFLSVWPYTDLDDPRLSFGKRAIVLRQDSSAKSPCKLGLNCEDGWIAYLNGGSALVKRFEHFIDAEYPDNGCSIESYSCSFMLEIETLSPVYDIGPGVEIVHDEIWEAMDGIAPDLSEDERVELFRSK